MSIILKGMCNFESTTITPPKPEDIAPNVVSNVSFIDKGKGSITVKWTDPDDTVLEGVTIAKWYRTVLVYKKGSAPTSITDGQTVNNYTKNQYLYNGYPLTIDINVDYYFKFYTVSDKNKTNTSDRSYIFSSKGPDPIFGNNSWETIAQVAESGSIPSTWKIGDIKDLVLSGVFNETVTMQIWDFDHFDKSDGTGKAKLCLGMKDLMKDRQIVSSNGPWKYSYMRNTVMTNVFNSIPIELRNHIKEVKTEANDGSGAGPNTDFSTTFEQSIDKIFIPGCTEINANWINYDGSQIKFPIFSDDISRIKRLNNGNYDYGNWWTRSCYIIYPYEFCSVDGFGEIMFDCMSTNDMGVCLCFNL